jgi:hypothetical protein
MLSLMMHLNIVCRVTYSKSPLTFHINFGFCRNIKIYLQNFKMGFLVCELDEDNTKPSNIEYRIEGS